MIYYRTDSSLEPEVFVPGGGVLLVLRGGEVFVPRGEILDGGPEFAVQEGGDAAISTIGLFSSFLGKKIRKIRQMVVSRDVSREPCEEAVSFSSDVSEVVDVTSASGARVLLRQGHSHVMKQHRFEVGAGVDAFLNSTGIWLGGGSKAARSLGESWEEQGLTRSVFCEAS